MNKIINYIIIYFHVMLLCMIIINQFELILICKCYNLVHSTHVYNFLQIYFYFMGIRIWLDLRGVGKKEHLCPFSNIRRSLVPPIVITIFLFRLLSYLIVHRSDKIWYTPIVFSFHVLLRSTVSNLVFTFLCLEKT
jgi:hypothetical protein